MSGENTWIFKLLTETVKEHPEVSNDVVAILNTLLAKEGCDRPFRSKELADAAVLLISATILDDDSEEESSSDD